ncbi:MAG: glycerol dehydratase reactivase beta/small subunit family protein [Desulforhabdus sp.]|jgi:hypothetical protein|nr:glycerol dehydratase reactivase beta/small subunit family protein [Desulforhabdus sp.]
MNQKPAIVIFVSSSAPTDLLQPVLWGMEEEGIPFEIHQAANSSIGQLAKQAADSSPLNVGMAQGGDAMVALHHRDLPAETPLFTVNCKNAHSSSLRLLGINAARLVKGQPLAFYEHSELNTGPGNAPQAADSRLEYLVALVLDEVLKEGYR